MGIQVAFVQSPEDEAVLVAQLLAKYDLLVIPRSLPHAKLTSQRLGTCPAPWQLVHLPEHAERLLDTIRRVDTNIHGETVDPSYSIDVTACRGL